MLGVMRKIADIRTFEDRPFLRRTSQLSLVAFAAGTVATLVAAVALTLWAPGSFDPELARAFWYGGGAASYLLWIAEVAVATVLSLALHEVVHAMLFKAFAPRGTRVTFGANWKLGMIYACAEGIVYPRSRYLVVAIAPTVAVTLVAVLVGAALGHPVAGLLVATIHLSGCAGDWGYVEAIRRNPAISYCEDTTWGVVFYGEGEGPAAGDADDAAEPELLRALGARRDGRPDAACPAASVPVAAPTAEATMEVRP